MMIIAPQGIDRLRTDFDTALISDLVLAVGNMTHEEIAASELAEIFEREKKKQISFPKALIRHKNPTDLWFYTRLFKSITSVLSLNELQKYILLKEPQVIFWQDYMVANVFISEYILQFMIDNDIIERAMNSAMIPNAHKYCRTSLLQSATTEQAIYMKMRWGI